MTTLGTTTGTTIESKGPLAGHVILDLSTVGPASRCTRILADYGAQVIKVGALGPDAKQIIPPFFAYGGHRGMRRILIDLKSRSGRETFYRMVKRADALVESFRPGTVDRLGINYDQLHSLNSKLVYCSTSGYGQEGVQANRAGHDLNYLAVAGYLGTSSRQADGKPSLPGATIADAAAGGMQAALAICAALLERERTKSGTYLDVSVADGVLWLMSLAVDQYLATGEMPTAGSDLLTGRYACYDLYVARDGGWLAVGAIEAIFFERLCRTLGCEGWISHQFDDSAQDQIRAAFATAFSLRDRDEWIDLLADANTCVAPVNYISEVVTDPQFQTRNAFVAAEHAEAGRFYQVGPVLAGQRRITEPIEVQNPDVTDVKDVLAELGFRTDEILALQGDGVVV